jgi:hypothetical protein
MRNSVRFKRDRITVASNLISVNTQSRFREMLHDVTRLTTREEYIS